MKNDYKTLWNRYHTLLVIGVWILVMQGFVLIYYLS